MTVNYDETRDQSEQFGWKKVKDERRPSEEEQERWSRYCALIVAKLGAVTLILEA